MCSNIALLVSFCREINPYTGKPFGTDEDIARCHPAGTLVSAREYNAMERKWCRQVALDPSRDPFNVTESYRGLIAIARGVFDRRYVTMMLLQKSLALL